MILGRDEASIATDQVQSALESGWNGDALSRQYRLGRTRVEDLLDRIIAQSQRPRGDEKKEVG